jgi:hypothetical protein
VQQKVPPRSRGGAPTPRRPSYPDRPSDTSVPAANPRPVRREDIEARVLAVLALDGPLEYPQIRYHSWLEGGPTCTALAGAVASLVACGRLEAVERSEIVVIDGSRAVRHFTLYSVRREGGA